MFSDHIWIVYYFANEKCKRTISKIGRDALVKTPGRLFFNWFLTGLSDDGFPEPMYIIEQGSNEFNYFEEVSKNDAIRKTHSRSFR